MRNTTNHVSMSSEIFSVYALESIRNVVSETPDTGELLMAFILSNIVYLNDSAFIADGKRGSVMFQRFRL